MCTNWTFTVARLSAKLDPSKISQLYGIRLSAEMLIIENNINGFVLYLNIDILRPISEWSQNFKDNENSLLHCS